MAVKSIAEVRTSICVGASCAKNGCSTYYVHLNNGKVETVTHVAEVRVTEDEVVFCRKDGLEARYRRAAVYFACCQENASPPQC